MIKTIGNNISYRDTKVSTVAEVDSIVNPSHGDTAYVIQTQQVFMYDGELAKWVEQ